MASLGDFRSSITSTRALLGTVLGVDLLWRGIPELLSLLKTDTVPVVLSVYIELIDTLPLISHLITLTLVVTVLYEVIPQLFPSVIREHARTRQFRLLGAGMSMIAALPWWYIFRSRDTVEFWSVLGLLFGSMAVATAGYLLYFHAITPGGVLDPDGPGMSLLVVPWSDDPDAMRDRFREGLQEVHDHPLATRYLVAGVMILAIGTIGALLSLVAGLFALIAGSFFPVLEAVVIVWLLGQTVGSRHPFTRLQRIVDRVPDIETHFYDHLTLVTTGRKGQVVALLPLLGLGISAMVFLIGRRYLSPLGVVALLIERVATVVGWLLGSNALPLAGSLVSTWILVGKTIALWGFGLYGFWYWFRMVRRAPAFIAAWSERTEGTDEVVTGRINQRIARPPGLMMPPALLLAAWAVTNTPGRVPGVAPWVVDYVFGAAWPLLVGLMIWTAISAYRRAPQPPMTDRHVFFVAFYVQITAFGAARGVMGGEVMRTIGNMLVIGVLLAWFYYRATFQEWTRGLDTGGEREIAGMGYSLAVAAGILAIGAVFPTTIPTVLVAALFVGLGVVTSLISGVIGSSNPENATGDDGGKSGVDGKEG